MVKSGYLKKRGEILPRWKTRYFELSSLELSYYEYEGGPKKGEIILTKTTKIRIYPINMIENTFQIRDKRTNIEVYLCAETEYIQNSWIEALTKSIERIKLPLFDSPKIKNNLSSSSLSNILIKNNTNQINLLTSSNEISSNNIITSTITPNNNSNNDNNNRIYGYCRCNAVEIEIENNPIIHGYCHCLFCQKYSSSPFICVILYPTKCIKISKGKLFIGKFNMTRNVNRYFCRQCLCYLMHEYVTFPSGSCTAVLYGTISSNSVDIFQPQIHINYKSKLISIPDGLPKYAGLPTIWGGNDDTIILEE